jgi:hypothetical protein
VDFHLLSFANLSRRTPVVAINCPSGSAPERSGLWSFADRLSPGANSQLHPGRRSEGCQTVSVLTDVRLAGRETTCRARGGTAEREHFPCLRSDQGIHAKKKLLIIVRVRGEPVCPRGWRAPAASRG